MRVGVMRELRDQRWRDRRRIDRWPIVGALRVSPRAEAELAFTALVMRHGPLVFGVCQGLLRNAHDAEDAFQATFMVLARKAGSIRQPDRLGPWLRGVAHRTARRLKDKTRGERSMRRRQRCTATVRTVRADQVTTRPCWQITTRSKPCIEKSSGCPRGIRRPSCSATSRGSRTKRRLGGSDAGSARSSRKCPARERPRRRLDRRGLAFPGGIFAAAIDSTRPSVLPNVLVGSTVKNVMSLSTGLASGSVPASIVSLSHGALKSMLFAKIGLISAALVGLGVAATGVGVGVGVVGRAPRPAPQQPAPERPALNPEPVAVAAVGPRRGRRRTRQRDGIDPPHATNLKRIAEAILAYREVNNGNYPAAAIIGPNGTPLLSCALRSCLTWERAKRPCTPNSN